MDKYFVLLVGICLISGACCFPNGLIGTKESAVEADNGSTTTAGSISVDTSTSSTNGSNGSVTLEPKPTAGKDDPTPAPIVTAAPPPNTTNTTTAPTTTPITTPTTTATTTIAPTTSPNTTTQATTTPTTPTTPATTTTVITTTTVSPTTTTSVTAATTTPMPTPAPSKDRRFDGPSFIGGIVLSLGIMAIAFVAFKFYKARTERNYHTL